MADFKIVSHQPLAGGTRLGPVETSSEVDAYIATSTMWPDEMSALRPLLLDAGLDEEIKWRKPCYSDGGANIAVMQEMKNFLSLMFFKGALLSDTNHVLQSQGANTRSALRMVFTSVDEVNGQAEVIRALIDEAIEVERSGIELPPPPELVLVDELQHRLDNDPELKKAFESLTPGRRRYYNIHISEAKQASTRESRIDKCIPKILAGKGLRDR